MRRHALIIVALALGGLLVGAVIFAQPAGAQVEGTSIAQDASQQVRISLAEAFFIQKNRRTGSIELLGSLIIWFLLALSASSIALMIAIIRSNRRQDILPGDLLEETRSALRREDFDGAEAALKGSESYFARVMRAAINESNYGYDAMMRAFERATEEFTADRLRRVETLNIIGAVSPMIGLFGTVYGMILAFQEIVSAGGSPDPVGLASGIGTALTTTFWGLVVAIPALAGYALIRNSIDSLTAETSLAIEDMLNRFRPEQAGAEKADRTPVGVA